MNVIIKNNYVGKLPINIEKRLRKLLKGVPNDYLVGLKMIIVLNTIAHRNNKNANGLYIPGSKTEPPRIEIALDTLFDNFPKYFMLMPFFVNYFIAEVLYHEVGHHYHIEKCRLKKKKWEEFAESIADELLKKNFFVWKILLCPLFLFIPILKIIRKKMKG